MNPKPTDYDIFLLSEVDSNFAITLIFTICVFLACINTW
jgi:hypothetical protein